MTMTKSEPPKRSRWGIRRICRRLSWGGMVLALLGIYLALYKWWFLPGVASGRISTESDNGTKVEGLTKEDVFFSLFAPAVYVDSELTDWRTRRYLSSVWEGVLAEPTTEGWRAAGEPDDDAPHRDQFTLGKLDKERMEDARATAAAGETYVTQCLLRPAAQAEDAEGDPDKPEKVWYFGSSRSGTLREITEQRAIQLSQERQGGLWSSLNLYVEPDSDDAETAKGYRLVIYPAGTSLHDYYAKIAEALGGSGVGEKDRLFCTRIRMKGEFPGRHMSSEKRLRMLTRVSGG